MKPTPVDAEGPLPRGLPATKQALRSAKSTAGLAVYVVAVGLVQLCCLGGVQMDLYDPWARGLGVASWIASLLGALACALVGTLFHRGVGGSRGGRRYDNMQGRIEAGTAQRPGLLPHVYIWTAIGAGLITLSELLSLAAFSQNFARLGSLAVITVALALGFGAMTVWTIVCYRRWAPTLRRLPPPVPPPPGAMPVAGSLESVALWFGRNAVQACMLGAWTGLAATLIYLAGAIFGGAPEALAGIPLPAFAGYACFRGRQELDTGLRTRDHRAQRGLLWGIAGGAAGSMPLAVTAVVATGSSFGWWSVSLDALPPLLQAALGQPGGLCFSPFALPLAMCGVALGAFGRELTTPRTAEERLQAQQLRGDP